MDGLSAIATIAQVVQISAQCATVTYNIIQQLRHAPGELLALSNEITDSSLVLREVEMAYNVHSGNTNLCEALELLLNRAQPLWTSLKSLVEEIRVEELNGAIKVHRRKWLRQRSRAKTLQDEIRGIRASMHEVLCNHSSSRLVRAESLIRSEQTQAAKLHLDTRVKLDSHIQSNAKIASLVRETSSQMQQLLTRFEDFSSNLIVAHPRSRVTSIPTPNSTQLQRSNGKHTSRSLLEDTTCQGVREYKPQVQMSSAVTQNTSTTVAFLVHRYLNNTSLCPCRCHTRAYFRARLISAEIFGSIFAGYSGVPFLNGPCDVTACPQNCGKSFDLMYTFPSWFVQWALYTRVAISAAGEPSFGIAFLRRSQVTEASIFAIARRGEHQKLRQILETQSALSRDVEVTSGRNALFWAIQSESIESVSVLLQYGADALTADDAGLSPSNYAYYLSLVGHLDPKYLSDLEKLLPKSDSESILEFPYLHRVVCRILPLDLRTELQNPRYYSQVEARDKKGNTALYWAATRGDGESVAQLLLAGANPNARSLNQGTPLIASGRASTPRCIELLLQARADPNAANYDGFSALHCVSQFQDNPAYLAPLLMAGANINSVTKRNFTPLMVSVFEKRPKMCKFLIQKGADFNVSSLVGHPPIFEAIRRHSHDCLKLLLEAGADCTVVAKDTSTILHHAARYGNIKTLEMLAEAEIGNVDPFAIDSKGRKAIDLAAARERSIPGFMLAFSTLEDTVFDGSTTFHDALEVQEAA